MKYLLMTFYLYVQTLKGVQDENISYCSSFKLGTVESKYSVDKPSFKPLLIS